MIIHPPLPTAPHHPPLSIPRSCLLYEALKADLIPPPRKTTTPPNADMSKYCRYHRNHGHIVEDYTAL